MSQSINNLKQIYQRDLIFMENRRLRILKYESEIKNLEAFFKPEPIILNRYNKTSGNMKKSNSNKKKTVRFNLPSINTIPNKTLTSYEKMKNYKVFNAQRKNNKSENKVKNFLAKSCFPLKPILKTKIIENTKNKDEGKKEGKIQISKININLTKKTNALEEIKNEIKQKFMEDKPNTQRSNMDDGEISNNQKKRYKKINFDDYLKMQAKAEFAFKPKLGDNSKDLIEYINSIQDIRDQIINGIITEINNAENRFNNEQPSVDSEFHVKDQSLNLHKWKNLFYIRDYQRFFLKGLKGKISNSNYYLMQKKFLDINKICFSEPKGQPIKKLKCRNDFDYSEDN